MAGLATLLRALEETLDGSPWNGGKSPGLKVASEAVRVAVTDPQFLRDCVALELQLLREKGDGANLVPFVHVPAIRAGLAFGYWPPSVATGPHEHTAWTITAVIRNALDISVYDWAASYAAARLVESRVVHAVSPDVGYITAPTIHDVRNASTRWSLALHVLSDHDGLRPDGYPTSFLAAVDAQADEPYRQVHAARMRREKAVQMAELLSGAVPNPAACRPWFEDFMVGAASRRIAGLLRLDTTANAPLRRLGKIHPDLRLTVERIGPTTRLLACSGHGAHPQLDVTAEFAAPLAFVAEQAAFDVDALPGDLNSAERQSLARALTDSCLFEALP